MDKKYSQIKGSELNKKKVEDLEKQETELIKKLNTTFQKVADFAEHSNSFDNFTNVIKSKVHYSRKHLKPLGENKLRNGSRSSINRNDGYSMQPRFKVRDVEGNQNGSIG